MTLIFNLNYSQSKSETIEYINDKLKTNSNLMSGNYEIEVSKYGNMTLHRYDKTGFGETRDDLHFIDIFDFIDINIKSKVGTYDGKEYYDIIFECKNSNNCISEHFVHNGKKRRSSKTIIGIVNKKIFLSLVDKLNYLKKISEKL